MGDHHDNFEEKPLINYSKEEIEMTINLMAQVAASDIYSAAVYIIGAFDITKEELLGILRQACQLDKTASFNEMYEGITDGFKQEIDTHAPKEIKDAFFIWTIVVPDLWKQFADTFFISLGFEAEVKARNNPPQNPRDFGNDGR